jgi:hypothetical protein
MPQCYLSATAAVAVTVTVFVSNQGPGRASSTPVGRDSLNETLARPAFCEASALQDRQRSRSPSSVAVAVSNQGPGRTSSTPVGGDSLNEPLALPAWCEGKAIQTHHKIRDPCSVFRFSVRWWVGGYCRS